MHVIVEMRGFTVQKDDACNCTLLVTRKSNACNYRNARFYSAVNVTAEMHGCVVHDKCGMLVQKCTVLACRKSAECSFSGPL